MKALTLTQPWASLMAAQQKTIETRSWPTRFRGEMVIHAAKGFPSHCKELCLTPKFATALCHRQPSDLPLSVGLCVVRVIGCVGVEEMHKAEFILGRKPDAKELLFGNYAPGRFAWLTEFVKPMDDMRTVRGALGLWGWPEVQR